jgi:hypothetical protein
LSLEKNNSGIRENKIIESMLNLTQEENMVSSPEIDDRIDNSISRWKRHNLNILMNSIGEKGNYINSKSLDLKEGS